MRLHHSTRRLVPALALIGALAATGCGAFDPPRGTTAVGGVIREEVGPLDFLFDMIGRVVVYSNGNTNRVGMEIVRWDDNAQALWYDYYIEGNDSEGSDVLKGLKEGVPLTIRVGIYSGYVSARTVQ